MKNLNLKRIMSALFVLLMIVGMSAPAFASDAMRYECYKHARNEYRECIAHCGSTDVNVAACKMECKQEMAHALKKCRAHRVRRHKAKASLGSPHRV